jgi:hypothetical protein
MMRRDPDSGSWGQARRVVAGGGDADFPFPRFSPDDVIWLFWRGVRAGQTDLFHKRLIVAV